MISQAKASALVHLHGFNSDALMKTEFSTSEPYTIDHRDPQELRAARLAGGSANISTEIQVSGSVAFTDYLGKTCADGVTKSDINGNAVGSLSPFNFIGADIHTFGWFWNATDADTKGNVCFYFNPIHLGFFSGVTNMGIILNGNSYGLFLMKDNEGRNVIKTDYFDLTEGTQLELDFQTALDDGISDSGLFNISASISAL